VEGSIGFTRARGKRAQGPCVTVPTVLNSDSERCVTQLPDTFVGTLPTHGRGNELRSRTGTSEHEQADRHDPDFDRRYSKWISPSGPRQHVPQFFTSESVYGQHLNHQQQTDPATSHVPFQTTQSFQVLHHPLTLQSGGHTVSMMTGSPFDIHSHHFQGQHLHHPGVLHEQGHMQMVQPHRQVMGQPLMQPSQQQGPVAAGLNVFPYSSMWLPNVASRNSEWHDPPSAGLPLAASTGNFDRQRRFATGSADTLLRGPPPAAYGLDSSVDFPSLSDAQSLAKQ
jgi:hypothetical protein